MRRPLLWAGAYGVLASAFALAFAGAILLGPYRAVERSDFMTYQVAARIVLDGHGSCLYDEQCQAGAQLALIGEEPSFLGNVLPFNSPPWFAALVAPLGLLPLRVAFAIFTLLGLAVLGWGTWQVAGPIGSSPRWPRVLAVILLLTAWPTVMAAIRGQSTLLAAGLLGLSVGLPTYRSGLALGLSALKPTLPPIWATWQLTGRHWRAVGTALPVALAYILLAVVVVSPEALLAYPAHLVGVAGGDVFGVHPAEMVNWRGAAERLGLESWFVVAGSVGTVGLVALVWFRSASRQLGGAAALLATPLLLPHANQHEFVLASVGIVLAVVAVPAFRRPLAFCAIAMHVALWAGIALDARAGAWLLFGAGLGWLAVVTWLSGRSGERPAPVPLPSAGRG